MLFRSAFNPWTARPGLRKTDPDEPDLTGVGYWYEPATGQSAVVPWSSVRADLHHCDVIAQHPDRFGIDPGVIPALVREYGAYGTDEGICLGLSRGWVRLGVSGYGDRSKYATVDARTPALAQAGAKWLGQHHPGLDQRSEEDTAELQSH